MKKNTYKYILFIMTLIILSLSLACTRKEDKSILDPDKPTIISLWHYYNGNTLKSFDRLVAEFNETLGMSLGIVVETQSYGEIIQLETALFEAANKSIGSDTMPDIFATYPDSAYGLLEFIDLLPLDKYFTEEELGSYRKEFIEEGYILDDGKPYILPVAKSTENLFVNKTDWEPFAKEYGFSEENLKTWDGIYQVAEKYYEVFGKSFFNIDSVANFNFLISKQLDSEIIYRDKDGEVKFKFEEDLARTLWEIFYIPYLKGYYAKSGRFSTDDAKTGEVIAFIGATSGSGYFPKEVTREDLNTYDIDSLVLPIPYIDENRLYAINQGAGMAIAVGNEANEYAASIFLKWFTETKTNIRFALDAGYFPVKKAALEGGLFLNEVKNIKQLNPVMKKSIITTIEMLEEYTLYSNYPSKWSYNIRKLLGTSLSNKLEQDLIILNEGILRGEDRTSLIKNMISDEEFFKWYNNIVAEAEAILR